MESINDIQLRLQGLEDIKHLLRSVRAMSAIRWRRAKQHLAFAQSYAKNIDSQLATVLARLGSDSPLGFPPTLRAEMNASMSADHPHFRSRSLRQLQHRSDRQGIHVTEILDRKNKDVKIISLGGYGERLFKNAGYEIFHSEKITSSQAVSFINIRKAITHIQAFYEAGAIDELNILYNKFNYFGSYTPQSIPDPPPKISELMLTLLPLPKT